MKLAAEIGRCKAAQELGMPQGTLDTNLSVILNGHFVASVLSEEPLFATVHLDAVFETVLCLLHNTVSNTVVIKIKILMLQQILAAIPSNTFLTNVH